ncbi:class I SAM-dependent methyltransferase [Ottowia sp.]|uniref:class I SAM-dependent methyltransferase n=1 Tax=Ottowia sp. TaxID=1898956 RepID=UPI0025D84CFA|nr:class I SAM-dependent methyltransferase [Ottowia sp.]
MATVHSHEFLDDPRFKAAYSRGLQAIGTSDDYEWHWRIHVGLWAASLASKLEGDFVECGVNKGFLSSAIMQYLQWDRLQKTFYLLDTFNGVDERHLTPEEIAAGAQEKNAANLRSGFYCGDILGVRKNFAEWENVLIIQGSIPDSLQSVHATRVAYLHIDMNCAPPEVAALEFFWDKLVPGAVVLLDDYAYFGFRNQKLAMDEFASRVGIQICSLPTGQGLLFKPPSHVATQQA